MHAGPARSPRANAPRRPPPARRHSTCRAPTATRMKVCVDRPPSGGVTTGFCDWRSRGERPRGAPSRVGQAAPLLHGSPRAGTSGRWRNSSHQRWPKFRCADGVGLALNAGSGSPASWCPPPSERKSSRNGRDPRLGVVPRRDAGTGRVDVPAMAITCERRSDSQRCPDCPVPSGIRRFRHSVSVRCRGTRCDCETAFSARGSGGPVSVAGPE